MSRTMVLSLSLAACVGSDPNDVVGPFTGETRRFVVDSITVPRNNTEARELGGDLDGDGAVDNQLGMVIGTLSGMGNVTDFGADIIAAGGIKSTIEVTADSFTNDRSVGVRFVGVEGETATLNGGHFANGVYRSNRTKEAKVSGRTTAHLPVFVDADPSIVPLIGLELDLVPDGAGGYDVTVHGAVPHPIAVEMAYEASAQMITNFPTVHIGYLGMFDLPPRNWILEHDEFANNSLITALMAPDVRVEGANALSLGFRMHITPCADGTCAPTSAPSCFDRVKNGTETDIDCGGDCRGCVEGSTCVDAGDCETAGCTGGVCDAASCTNGVHDSFESDVDCGTFCGVDCAIGQRCAYDADCVSGVCGAPCDPDSYYCGQDYGVCN